MSYYGGRMTQRVIDLVNIQSNGPTRPTILPSNWDEGSPPPPTERERFSSDQIQYVEPRPYVRENEDDDDNEDDANLDALYERPYFTFHGPQMFWPNPSHRLIYFNHDEETTLYLRRAVRFAKFRYNLNDGYRTKTAADKNKLKRFFNLPKSFVDTFTENWNVMTILQFDTIRGVFYLGVIISNGIYSELEVITHLSPLPGDPQNIMFFELKSPGLTRWDVPILWFNTSWNDFVLAMQDNHIYSYVQITAENFHELHRSLQYMLLSFYIDGESNLYTSRDGVSDVHSQPWFDINIHKWLNEYVCHYGKRIFADMEVMKRFMINPGQFVLVEEILRRY